LENNYVKHYLDILDVYPSVYALKFFLGKNPDISFNREVFKGKKILDIGFGDGRDMSLFGKLGMDAHGIEISSEVVAHTRSKFSKVNSLGKFSFHQGFNHDTGFENETFDYVYSVAALMYLASPDIDIGKILNHVHSILKTNGWFVGTFARKDSHITSGAKFITENRVILSDPFYNYREGQLYHVHCSAEEARCDLASAGFRDVEIYDYAVDWFGTHEKNYIFTARK